MFGGQVGTFEPESLEIRGTEDQHLAGAIASITIVALSGLDLLRPGLEVL